MMDYGMADSQPSLPYNDHYDYLLLEHYYKHYGKRHYNFYI